MRQQASSASRSCARPRCTRDFMPDTERPSISAAAATLRPSSSTSVSASRYGDGSIATKAATQREQRLDAARSSSSSRAPRLGRRRRIGDGCARDAVVVGDGAARDLVHPRAEALLVAQPGQAALHAQKARPA
jgi:hypothetical protein